MIYYSLNNKEIYDNSLFFYLIYIFQIQKGALQKQEKFTKYLFILYMCVFSTHLHLHI